MLVVDGSVEDDGYFLSYVYDFVENKSEFVIFDVSNVEKDFIVCVYLFVCVLVGFYGSWILDLV